jgi:hypothetical protein
MRNFAGVAIALLHEENLLRKHQSYTSGRARPVDSVFSEISGKMPVDSHQAAVMVVPFLFERIRLRPRWL